MHLIMFLSNQKEQIKEEMICSIQKCNENLLEQGIRIAKIDKDKGDKHISNITRSLFCALIDSGSQVTTANHLWLIHKYKKISFK